jgi:hypothetical protein
VRVLAEGPYGAFTATLRRRRGVLLLAGGVGVAPQRALMETLPAGPGEMDLIYRASTPVEVLFPHGLARIAKARRVSVHYLVGSRVGGHPPGQLPADRPGPAVLLQDPGPRQAPRAAPGRLRPVTGRPDRYGSPFHGGSQDHDNGAHHHDPREVDRRPHHDDPPRHDDDHDPPSRDQTDGDRAGRS